MVVQCLNPINCEGVDAPLANLSAEAPDFQRFFGYSFQPDFSQLCEATSQELADICNPPPPYNPNIPIIYSSSPQSCTLPCADGGSETYTAASGTFVSFISQADADAQAAAFACELAQILCNGGSIDLFTNIAQSCTVTCANGSMFTYTTPAGLFTALSQHDADSNAYLFACALAALLCGGPPTGKNPGAGILPPQPEAPLWANSAQSCQFSCANGTSYVFTARAGLFIRPSLAEANSVAHAWACQQAVSHRVCLGSIQDTACAQQLYVQEVSQSGLSNPVTWSVTGDLPPGITQFEDQIFGYPSAGGTYSFTVRATGADGNYAQRSYSIRVLEIDPSSLPDGDTATPYAQALSTIGEQGSIVWSVVDGALPDGLTLNPNTGVISGTPTVAGTFTFTVQASET